MKPRTAYAVRKVTRLIRLDDVHRSIISVAMRVIRDVNKIGLISSASKLSITSAEYMSQSNSQKKMRDINTLPIMVMIILHDIVDSSLMI